MNSAQEFGLRLKQARERKKLSQKELSDLLNDGLNQSQLSKYESGDAMPRPERMKRFCEVLEVSEAWLRALARDEEEDGFVGYAEKTRKAPRNESTVHLDDYQALQRSELAWQRKHLEAERQVLELKGELLEREFVMAQLLEQLTLHTASLKALLSTMTPEQRAAALEARKGIMMDFKDLEEPAKRLDRTSDKLRSVLKSFESSFQDLERG